MTLRDPQTALTGGLEQAEQPVYVQSLVNLSKAKDEARGGGRKFGRPVVYASDAGKCSRAIGYRLAGVEGAPFDDVGRHVTMLGNLIHDAVQDGLPADSVEVPGTLVTEDGEVWLAFRADIVTDDEVVDLKSIGTYGYKLKLDSSSRGGPDMAHLVQIGLGMDGFDKPNGRLVYIAKEALAKRDSEKHSLAMDDLLRVGVEFTFTRDDIATVLDTEKIRLRRIWDMSAAGELPPRFIPYQMPKGGRVTDPLTGAWAKVVQHGDGPAELEDTGKAFICNYCAYQQVCAADLKQETQPKEDTNE